MTGSPSDLHNPLRYACDRCHSQKLRCPRSDDSAKPKADVPCSRCRKAGALCVVSVRGRVGRPSKAASRNPTRTLPTALVTDVRTVPDHAEPGPVVADCEMDQPCALSPGESIIDTMGMQPHPAALSQSPNAVVGGAEPDLASDVSSQAHHVSAAGQSEVGSQTSATTYCDPFCVDIDAEIDFTTMFLPGNLADTLEPATAATTHNNAAAEGIFMFSSGESTSDTAHHNDEASYAAGGLLPDKPPTPSFCSTTCYRNLQHLNDRIVSSIMRSTPTSSIQQMQNDLIAFSGELIEAARESVPHFVGSSSPPPSGALTTAKADSHETSCHGERTRNSHLVGPEERKKDKRGLLGAQPWSRSVPHSAVIFLLLGCHTQILHLLEILVNKLWDQHHNPAQHRTGQGNTTSVGSLMEVSLTIHTVTYLLGHLHRALTLQAPQGSARVARPDFFVEIQDWEKPLASCNEWEDSLPGRAFREMRMREQWLTRRMNHLQHSVNKFDS
ncbi:hypothetical protein CMUS01_02835 [Colletotrichum musicola]|uniref:Zn(2)-C6 fungal-type domain-containing protein n=1 Tax=Colletotrichum musicola TaxID=2175873 RepID=A0A8H6NUB2_9PEZI|nr:hypothetical protein CMUS01_02835 [Colletotrichum musicola]